MTTRKATAWSISSAEEIQRFFTDSGKRVISFAGFGELGYEDPSIVARVGAQVLGDLQPAKTIVNSGTLLRRGGEDGIAAIYPIAKNLGMLTSGIHPSVALAFRETHLVSAFSDHWFFVEDATWGGFLAGSREISPTLQVSLEVSDELIVIGGGKHAAEEIEAFGHRRKRVRYYAAEMNHRATRSWCQRSGTAIEDYRGAAHAAWLALQARNSGESQEGPPPEGDGRRLRSTRRLPSP
jgi:hypothetical protein